MCPYGYFDYAPCMAIPVPTGSSAGSSSGRDPGITVRLTSMVTWTTGGTRITGMPVRCQDAASGGSTASVPMSGGTGAGRPARPVTTEVVSIAVALQGTDPRPHSLDGVWEGLTQHGKAFPQINLQCPMPALSA